ncbi:Wzz/FepE/Etk N-terminal domain-containing protein [Pseudomonas sp. SED1]|uniref:Wzz/FepE/Etk N-terminal domain-containing protein n=1 Tax=Pseudomonas sp. SED1 TaxID=3056845 RepID=UPI00296FBCCD|nr:Wzz/FepE/Etk N-terminal domain-containing protein [Pseudomonas sp. SED1]MDY0835433.1 GNVR domain-containing protein [Pseudomonas sp. SED1]
MSSSFRAPSLPAPMSDEVDLVAIVKALWQQQRLLAASVMVGLLFAGIGIFISTPEYQVSSVLRPAALNELDALNRSEIYSLPPTEALSKLGASLESYETRLEFFRSNQKLFEAFVRPGRTLEQSFEAFNHDSVSIILPDHNKSDSLSAYVKIQLNYPQGVDGVSILNGFVDYAVVKERALIGSDLNVIVSNRLNELKGKLAAARAAYETEKEAKIVSLLEADSLSRARLDDELRALRTQLKTERGDRVSQLNEAISIARKLGIRKPSTPSSMSESEPYGANSIMRTEVNSQQNPMYFLGVDALEAERNALLQRKSDDFATNRIAQIAKELALLKSNREVEVLKKRENEDLFLSGVQPIRAEIARLKSLNLDMSSLKLVTVDKQALEPLSPIKPQKTLIVVLGMVFGLMAGVGIALTRHFFKPRG